MVFLPQNSPYLLYLRLDQCLDLKFDYVAQRKRVSLKRRASRMSANRVSLRKKEAFLEEQTPQAVRHFGKKTEAVMEDIEEGTDTDPEKEPFGMTSSVFFNSESQLPGFPEKSKWRDLTLS